MDFVFVELMNNESVMRTMKNALRKVLLLFYV